MYPESIRPPVLSICVPTFNRARYLECLLEDLANQMPDFGFPYEILIGDNASDDGTADVARRYEDRLAIRYIRRPQNVGSYHNLSQLFRDARGRYVTYLADDDLLIPSVLGKYIAYLEEHPDVGAVFAPWFLHNRISGVDFDRFYALDNETRIEARDHMSLFTLLVNKHIFPEIYVARTSLVREVSTVINPFAFFYFVQIAAMIERTAVLFAPEPFYRQVIQYFEDESRAQAGHEEVKDGWDRYRGGLEYILARFASLLSPEDLSRCQEAVDRFARFRMCVGLRVRTDQGKDWIDNYYIANRLRCAGDESLLPAPYETYRINAALEYLVQLQPFYPEAATIGYFYDDPPRILKRALHFSSVDLVELRDRSAPLPENLIVVSSSGGTFASNSAFVISEAELMAKFP